MWHGVQSVYHSLINLCYPPICLSCEKILSSASSNLCHECSLELQLIDPADCCQLCFNVLSHVEKSPCIDCRKQTHYFDRVASAFNYQGPAARLVQYLKCHQQTKLASGLASYLYTQVDNLQWPIPDFIIPVPLSSLRLFERGFNQSALLAYELAKFFKCPVQDILRRKSGGCSQASLSLKKRVALSKDEFWLRECANIEDKILYLIDDVMTSGATLNKCAEILNERGPAKIYGLTVCRTLRF